MQNAHRKNISKERNRTIQNYLKNPWHDDDDEDKWWY